MLDKKETLTTLQAFNTFVIKEARENLLKGGKYGTNNVTKKLTDSLKATSKVNTNSIENYIEIKNKDPVKDKNEDLIEVLFDKIHYKI